MSSRTAPLPTVPRSGRLPPLRLTAAALLAAAGLLLTAYALYIPVKAQVAQVLLNRAFAESLATGQPVKPWSWADTWPVARIRVPRLGESTIVLAGGSGQALAFGPGHLTGTPLPGDPGTSVIAAHRDTHFNFLGELNPGDEIDVERADGVTTRFRVNGSRVVRFDDFGIDPGAGLRRLVLATCWPLDAVTSGPLRLVIDAEETGPQRQQDEHLRWRHRASGLWDTLEPRNHVFQAEPARARFQKPVVAPRREHLRHRRRTWIGRLDATPTDRDALPSPGPAAI